MVDFKFRVPRKRQFFVRLGPTVLRLIRISSEVVAKKKYPSSEVHGVSMEFPQLSSRYPVSKFSSLVSNVLSETTSIEFLEKIMELIW